MTESARSYEVGLAQAAPTIGMVEPTGQGGMARGVAAGLQMQQRNPWAVWLGLPLVTIGIYHLFGITRSIRRWRSSTGDVQYLLRVRCLSSFS